MARFCAVHGLPHGIYPLFVSIAMAYLKKFSRDPESGALQYRLPPIDFRTFRPVARYAQNGKRSFKPPIHLLNRGLQHSD